uniref:AB hydrolase-1 domain-containing protein n=1 Tax=Aegilops tauschii TaxID=37682 RepID=M8B175_AEGTA
MAAPADQASSKHFVLVHGVCVGGWAWFKVATRLRDAGHRVSTPDLAASGVDPRPLREVPTFRDYSKPLLDLLLSVPPGEKVVLVGHSFGGVSIALACELFPEKVAAAVFVSAFMPDHRSPPSYVLEKEMGTAGGQDGAASCAGWVGGIGEAGASAGSTWPADSVVRVVLWRDVVDGSPGRRWGTPGGRFGIVACRAGCTCTENGRRATKSPRSSCGSSDQGEAMGWYKKRRMDWMDMEFKPQDPEGKLPISIRFGPLVTRAKFYQLCSPEDLTLGRSLMRVGSMFVDDLKLQPPYTEARYGSVRKVFIVLKDDNAIFEGFQRWMVQNYPVDEVREIHGADHMALLSTPDELARCLADVAVKYAA